MPRSTTDPNTKLLITPRQGIKLSGIPERLMYEAIATGEMPAVQSGKAWLVPRVALQEFVEKRAQKDSARRAREHRAALRAQAADDIPEPAIDPAKPGQKRRQNTKRRKPTSRAAKGAPVAAVQPRT